MRKVRLLCLAVVAAFLASMLPLDVAPAPVSASGHDGSPARRVAVFIAFHQQPGPAEEALVRGAGGDIKYTYRSVVPAIAATVPAAAIPGLQANPRVRRVEPDIEVRIVDHTTTSGDAELNNTWGVKHIGAGAVHAAGNTGAGVMVAVLDTGIDTNHPDLAYDPTCSNGTSYGTVEDGHGHGTHVTGTVAALKNGAGVVGVAPGATVCVFKVLSDSGGGSYSDVVAALDFISTYNQGKLVADRIRATNNSYGSGGDPGQTVKAAFDNLYAAGVLHAAAAGNSGNPPGSGDNCIYPARWDSLIATAATDDKDKRASWSSTCPELELSAPGVSIKSTTRDGGYGNMSGTSMASPHVAGTAALVLACGCLTDENGDGTVNHVDARVRLQKTAIDLGDPGRDTKYGYGLVDADKAVAGGGGGGGGTNTAPTADGKSVSTSEDTDVSITLSGSDAETCELTFSIVTGPSNGSLGAISNNACTSGSPNTDTASVTYTPKANFNGSDSFTYRVSDGSATADATVSISVSAVADAPVANNQSVSTQPNTQVSITLTGSDADGCDGQTFSFQVTGGPSNGTLSATSGSMSCSSGALSASVAYSPNANFTGSDSFTFTISDGALTSNTATVSISVTAGDPNKMGVFDISWNSSKNNLGFIVNIRRDSDGSGALTSGDSPVEAASVKVILIHDKNGDGVFDCSVDSCWSFSGNTDSKGNRSFKLVGGAPSGNYKAEVTGLAHATFSWNKALDVDNPDFFTR
ncbi:MAG: S8 family serine peptidase [Chloroflexi bacterium]|nr:S8 family serine peptidase [Chloroflexota bacterium]